MAIIDTINEGIKESIRAKNQIRLSTLRMLKAKILAVDARASLADDEVIKLFKSYYGSLEEAMQGALSANRQEMVDQLKEEMGIVKEFLPKALSEEETRKLVIQAIQECGAKTKKDLGFVMKAVMKLNSAVDGRVAKDIASELLVD